MKVAFATCEEWVHGFPDDRPTAADLEADFQVWSDPAVDWHAYDRVVLRSVWDYTARPETFRQWCKRVGPERLRNRPDLVAFNADKTYLRELDAPVVPTTFVAAGDPVPALAGEVVVKPNVSAGARNTGRFPVDRYADAVRLIENICASGRLALVQPYLPLLDELGETAIVYLGGELSHVLRKGPVLRGPGVAPLGPGANASAAVMREEDLVTAGEATPRQLELAAAVHSEIGRRFGTPLFARVDLVPGLDGEPVLIELEALDACLYLGQAPGAAARFAQAIRHDPTRSG